MAWGASTSKSLHPTEVIALTTSYQTIYTAPNYNANVTTPSATAKVVGITIANTTAGDLTFTVCKVPNAGVAGTTNQIYSAVTVKANDTKELDGLTKGLAAGGTIQALASATGVNIELTAEEYQ